MASLEESYDAVLLEILKKEGKIAPFMDVIFGFLYRRTDFYKILKEDGAKMGFPRGFAEKLASNAFKKYEKAARDDEELCLQRMRDLQMNQIKGEDVPEADNVVEVETSKTLDSKKSNILCAGDSYNGAIRETYSWSQSANDLDVRIKISADVVKAKCVKVDMSHDRLSVQCLDNETGHWKCLLDGNLLHRINLEKSVWTLTPGECILVCLEKNESKWWESLLVDEPKINVQEIDSYVNMEDLPQDEHAVVEELMYNEQQKILGKPTIEQMKVSDILRDAWERDGSPFKGQPFDPSIVNICGSVDELAKFQNSASK